MSARVYFMKTTNGCKYVSIMSLQVYSVCILQFFCFTKYTLKQSKHKQTNWKPRRKPYRLRFLTDNLNWFKGTGSVISSDPSCKDDNSRFTTVPLKALSEQAWIRYQCFCFSKLFIFTCGFSAKGSCPLQWRKINAFWDR